MSRSLHVLDASSVNYYVRLQMGLDFIFTYEGEALEEAFPPYNSTIDDATTASSIPEDFSYALVMGQIA